jgi:hypothetical protein
MRMAGIAMLLEQGQNLIVKEFFTLVLRIFL